MLKEQLQQEIEQEAAKLYPLIRDVKKKIGYEKGAVQYAALWQAAEEKAARYEKALEKIRDLTPYSSLTGDQRSETMVEIATEALTPKTSEDEQ